MAKRANQVELMIDSGAFGAWRQNQVLKVGRYSRFLEKYSACFNVAINLDVIPGAIGRKPSSDDLEASAKAGWQNLLRLRKDGHNIMPVYHLGERRYWLEKMMGEGFTYIGLGGLATKKDSWSKQKWLDKVFGYLCGAKGYPAIHVHGFGMTSLNLMFRYPWYSVDSITWMLEASYGSVMIPQLKDGKYDYSQAPLLMKVSRRQRDGKAETSGRWARHFDNCGKGMQSYVTDYLKTEGFDLANLHNNVWARMHQCVRFFKRVEEHQRPNLFTAIEHGLVIEDKLEGSRTPPAPVKIIYGICVGKDQSDVLQDEGVRERLLTYWWFAKRQPFDIFKYVETGRIHRLNRVKA